MSTLQQTKSLDDRLCFELDRLWRKKNHVIGKQVARCFRKVLKPDWNLLATHLKAVPGFHSSWKIEEKLSSARTSQVTC